MPTHHCPKFPELPKVPGEATPHCVCGEFATVVELRGIEPLTYSMRTSRATNCAIAP